MKEELESLRSHQTCRLVRRSESHGSKVITCRWVYALKHDQHGRIKRYKAR
ncbi:polyprotein [Phytophthora megakarya]|uniref:Polyprotein n=1 Tax=Phytophthora megakarya TaxID=4795 RepID=A0A225WM83_9STRA|nr:polyprotein [Phytophthora megakarya]